MCFAAALWKFTYFRRIFHGTPRYIYIQLVRLRSNNDRPADTAGRNMSHCLQRHVSFIYDTANASLPWQHRHPFLSPLYIIYYILYIIYTVHSTQYTVHSTQYTVHSTQYTVHSTQYTVHITQRTHARTHARARAHTHTHTHTHIKYTKTKYNKRAYQNRLCFNRTSSM